MKTVKWVAVLFVFSLTSFSLHSANWSQWRGEQRDGISSETDWRMEWGDEEPKVLWRKELGTGVSAFVVADGKAYSMGNMGGKDIVYCLDAESGKEVWTFEYDCDLDARMFEGGPGSTPLFHEGKLYTLSHIGHLHCLDAKTGKVIWKKHLQDDFDGRRSRWGYSGAPLVYKEKLLIEAGGNGSSVVALNKDSGDLIWKTGTAQAGYSSPIIFSLSGKDQVLFFTAEGLISYDPAKGNELWSQKWKTDYDVNAATPVILGENSSRIFVSSGYGTGSGVYDLSSGQPKKVWKSKKYQNQMNASVFYKGHLFGYHGAHVSKKGEHRFRCLNAENGKKVWETSASGLGSVILAGDKLLIFSQGGEFIIANASPEKYEEILRMQVLGGRSWVPLAFSNGLVFCRNNGGKAACLDLRKKSNE